MSQGEGDWYVGNAVDDGADRRGWIVGHFVDEDKVRRSDDVELKWGTHSAGEERAEWQGDEHRTTVLLLIKGRFRISLDERSHILEREGDYAMWGRGVGHSWKAEQDSVVLTVRWPSVS